MESPVTRSWRKVIAGAVALALALPAGAWAGPAETSPKSANAGPIKAAMERAGQEIVAAQPESGRSSGRFWTGMALIAGGGVLGALSFVELGDDETGPDDSEDGNGSDDGEDSDGWGNKAMLGCGIAAATLGGVLLMTGGKKRGPVVGVKRSGVVVRQTISF